MQSNTYNPHSMILSTLFKDENGEKLEPTMEEFKLQRILGTGAYAVVKLATHEKSLKKVALKLYSLNKID